MLAGLKGLLGAARTTNALQFIAVTADLVRHRKPTGRKTHTLGRALCAERGRAHSNPIWPTSRRVIAAAPGHLLAAHKAGLMIKRL